MKVFRGFSWFHDIIWHPKSGWWRWVVSEFGQCWKGPCVPLFGEQESCEAPKLYAAVCSLHAAHVAMNQHDQRHEDWDDCARLSVVKNGKNSFPARSLFEEEEDEEEKEEEEEEVGEEVGPQWAHECAIIINYLYFFCWIGQWPVSVASSSSLSSSAMAQTGPLEHGNTLKKYLESTSIFRKMSPAFMLDCWRTILLRTSQRKAPVTTGAYRSLWCTKNGAKRNQRHWI